MRIGVFSVIFQQLPFEQALDKILSYGATAVEIGTGGYPGAHHCPIDELLASTGKRRAYLKAVEARGMLISAFSCHWNPLDPDKPAAAAADELFRKTVRLAEMLAVPAVNVMAGLPAGSPTDKTPNWVTCPWPPHFLEILDYQWNQVGIPYWRSAAKFAEDHQVKIGVEMHPGMLIYNVETMLRMRAACGPAMGCNFDPSHLFWNGVDPVAAIRTLLKNALMLFQCRGTALALKTYLEIYTAGKAHITERRATNFSLGQSSQLGMDVALGKNNQPDSLSVALEVSRAELERTKYSPETYQRKISELVRTLVPAHVLYDVKCEFSTDQA